MIGKIQWLICFGLLGSLRHPSRAADIDALPRMYSTARKKKEFGTASEYIPVLERPRLLPFEIIVVDPFDGISLRRAYSDIEVDE